MFPLTQLIVNFAAFQLGWFGSVLGAAHGWPLTGPVLVAAVVAIHLLYAKVPSSEFLLILIAAGIGAVFDSLLVASGWLSYSEGNIVAGAAPYWIVGMWMLFATTLNVSLRWLRNSALLAAALGAIAGPLSYYGGARLGGLEFADFGAGLIALSIGWGLMMPLLSALARRLDGMAPVAEDGHV